MGEPLKQEAVIDVQQKMPKHRPFGMRDKLGYMFGDFGNDGLIVDSQIIQKGSVDFKVIDKVHQENVEIGQVVLQIIKKVEYALKGLR